jgi:hypothetical protein
MKLGFDDGAPETVSSGEKRVRGIEPPYAAWEAAVLPLNYTRERKLGVYS